MEYLKRVGKDRSPLVSSALVALASTSGLVTFKGIELAMDVDGISWTGRATAFVVAASMTIGMLAAWKTAYRANPRFARGPGQVLGVSITGIYVAGIITVSSVFNVVGLAGDAALERHMFVGIAAHEEALDQTYRRARLAEQVIPDVKREEQYYAAAAQQENLSGVRTGGGGTGTVYFSMRAVSDRLKELREDINRATGRASELAVKARGQLELMRRAAAGDVPLAVRMRKLGEQQVELRGTLIELGNLGIADTLGRALQALPRTIGGRKLSARSAAGRQAQAEALEAIRRDLEVLSSTLGTALNEITNLPPIDTPEIAPMNPVRAVFRYAGDFMPFWSLGIGLDVIPLIILAYMMVPAMTLSEREKALRGVLELTIGEVVAAKAAEGIQRKGVVDGRTIAELEMLTFGQQAEANGGEDVDKD